MRSGSCSSNASNKGFLAAAGGDWEAPASRRPFASLYGGGLWWAPGQTSGSIRPRRMSGADDLGVPLAGRDRASVSRCRRAFADESVAISIEIEGLGGYASAGRRLMPQEAYSCHCSCSAPAGGFNVGEVASFEDRLQGDRTFTGIQEASTEEASTVSGKTNDSRGCPTAAHRTQTPWGSSRVS